MPKRALFDPTNNYFSGYSPDCHNDKNGMKKCKLDAMTMVAIAFTSEKWKWLFEDDCDITDMRSIVGQVV